jgi:hypothetical protein
LLETLFGAVNLLRTKNYKVNHFNEFYLVRQFYRNCKFLLHMGLVSFFGLFKESCEYGEEPDDDGQAVEDGADWFQRK